MTNGFGGRSSVSRMEGDCEIRGSSTPLWMTTTRLELTPSTFLQSSATASQQGVTYCVLLLRSNSQLRAGLRGAQWRMLSRAEIMMGTRARRATSVSLAFWRQLNV